MTCKDLRVGVGGPVRVDAVVCRHVAAAVLFRAEGAEGPAGPSAGLRARTGGLDQCFISAIPAPRAGDDVLSLSRAPPR